MMSMKERYHILPDRKSGGGAMVFDSETGAIQYPTCWLDLSAFYHYLVGRGRIEESQKLLAESMAGRRPITDMVAHASRPGAPAAAPEALR